MKRILFLTVMLFSAASVFSQTASAPVEFSETKFSFGKIKQNSPVTHVFVFKNTSGKPVVIQDAAAGCGCTTPVFPKSAIAKGASDKISVTFNAATPGIFTKDVTVRIANVTEPIMLKIEGEVVPADAASAKNKRK